MKALRYLVALCSLLALYAVPSGHAAEPALPEYLLKAQALIGQAETKAAQLKDSADDILIGKNYIRNAEAEYKKNLGWSGKIDEKAEPTVRYFAAMAQLQASIILSRAEKIAQEKECSSLETQAALVRKQIKVFDDKNAEIAALKKEMEKRLSEKDAEIAKRDATIADLNKQMASLNADLATKAATGSSAGQKVAVLTGEVQTLKWSLSAAEQKSSELAADLDIQKKGLEKANSEIVRLKDELAKKGVEANKGQEQLQALNRQQEFMAEVGKLGGVIKSGTDNMTVIFSRSGMLKSPKNDGLTVDGNNTVGRVADLLIKYPEYRLKIKVHGFGQGKTEDASATDRMARLIREALVDKGKLEPSTVEALGAGVAEPIYPKSNPEGNKRVEVTFVKK